MDKFFMMKVDKRLDVSADYNFKGNLMTSWSQPVFTCSKLAMQNSEQCVKYVPS